MRSTLLILASIALLSGCAAPAPKAPAVNVGAVRAAQQANRTATQQARESITRQREKLDTIQEEAQRVQEIARKALQLVP